MDDPATSLAGHDSPEVRKLTFSDFTNGSFPERFASMSRVVTRDLNDYTIHGYHGRYHRWKYTKDDIIHFLQHPARYERQLREAAIYIYNVSPHFRRIIQYFAGLSDFAYVVSPYKVDPKRANKNTINRNYRRVLNTMSAFNVRSQFPKILTVCLREDVFYGTIWDGADTITVQQLPSNYCKISVVEGNVCNVTFDFTYFDVRPNMLQYFPPEFTEKYELYKKDREHSRWQELESPNSFAIKCNDDILAYAIPPFAGVLPEVFDLEAYKEMKKNKTALENYAILVETIPMDDEGNLQMPYDTAVDFWRNLDNVLPEEVGSVLTPMQIDKISFEKSNTGDTDTVVEAEENIFNSAGVSSLLFGNTSPSANALLLSIKADQNLCFRIVKSIEDAINRYIWEQPYGKNFKVTFLDVSSYNRKEMGDAYLKAAQYGFPTLSMYAASQGLGQSELDSMSFLETDVIGLTDMFHPLQSSATMSSDSEGATAEGGAPEKDVDELTEKGEQTREAQ